MIQRNEMKQTNIKRCLIQTYTGTFRSVQTALMAASPLSFIILSSLSTIMNNEFHWVAFGRSSWMEKESSTASAAIVDFPHLFHSAWHLLNVERYTFMSVSLTVAFAASTAETKLSRWQAHIGDLGAQILSRHPHLESVIHPQTPLLPLPNLPLLVLHHHRLHCCFCPHQKL